MKKHMVTALSIALTSLSLTTISASDIITDDLNQTDLNQTIAKPSYIPITLLDNDDAMTVLVPKNFKSEVTQPQGYTPPADSIAHTTIVTTDGKKMRIDRIKYGFVIEGHQNQVVVLEVFGYTCPHCLRSIGPLNRLKAKYGDDLYILAFESYGLSDAQLKAFKKEKGITYDVVAKDKAGNLFQMLQDFTGAIPGVPWTHLLAPNGNLSSDPHLGDIEFNDFDSQIQNLLN